MRCMNWWTSVGGKGGDVNPISVSCWVEDDGAGGDVSFNLEYVVSERYKSLGKKFKNFTVTIPGIDGGEVNVVSVDGQYKCENGSVVWYNSVVEDSGAIEFYAKSTGSQGDDGFFPVGVEYEVEGGCAGVKVEVEGEADVRYVSGTERVEVE